MSVTVKLSDIIQGLDEQSYEIRYYIDTTTGELTFITEEDNWAAESDDSLKDYPEWQQEMITKAREILEDEENRFLPLGERIDNYRIMELFCESVPEYALSEKLLNVIRGRGAFRRFKDIIFEFGIEQDWYAFRDHEYKNIAVNWCDAEGLNYIDDVPGKELYPSFKNKRNDRSSLTLSEAEMKSAGYQVVDAIVDHFLSLPEQKVAHHPGSLEYSLSEDVFLEAPTPFGDVLKDVTNRVFEECRYATHPRFFAFVPGPGNFVSVMADALMSGYNAFAGTWLESAGPAKVELATINWLREQIGMPETAGGLFVSGGSQANLTAIATARHKKLGENVKDAVILCSDQTHSSVDRAARILGFSSNQVLKIPSDDKFRMDIIALKDTVRKEKKDGKRPFCIVANAGTTNCGAIDPLNDIADLCENEDIWMHVDGAYGASAVITQRGEKLLKGLERSDSVTLDPHKWLFQPFEIGCVIVKNSPDLKDTFHILPEYLEDIQSEGPEINFCDYGSQLTRNFKSLKLWMSLRVFGMQSFREAIEKGFELSEYTESVIRKYPEFHVVTPAQMAIITFQYVGKGMKDENEQDRVNKRIIELSFEEGSSMISSTRLKNRTVLRMCTINPRTTRKNIDETIALLKKLGDHASHEVM